MQKTGYTRTSKMIPGASRFYFLIFSADFLQPSYNLSDPFHIYRRIIHYIRVFNSCLLFIVELGKW